MPSRNGMVLWIADCVAFLAALALSGFLAQVISKKWLEREFIEFFSSPDARQQMVLYGVLAASGLLFFSQKEHYGRRAPWWQQVEHVAAYCCIAFLIEGFVNYALKTPVTRLWVGLSWILAIPCILLFRRAVRRFLVRLGQWEIPTILTGGCENMIETLCALKSETYLRYKILYAVLPHANAGDIENFRAVHGDVEIRDTLGNTGPGDMVILCPNAGQEMRLKHTIDSVLKSGAEYAVVPPVDGFSLYGMQPAFFFGYNVVFLRPYHRLATIGGRALKGAMDKAGAAVALALLSPLFFLIVRKVRKDGGPAFYSQTRIGEKGRPFTCWKFRSMAVNAEEILKDMLEKDPVARAEWEKDFKLKNDPRITKIGDFLRRTSLDELPQLFNVLRGEMSLVGPRPVVEEEIKNYGDRLDDYLSVKPGMTGLWQVSGRNDITYAQRVYLDSWYVRHWSVWNDIVIIIKTVFVVLSRRGAY